MDESLHKLLWILGGGGFGAALGGVFGAVTGAIYWGSGRAAGTVFGQRVASAFVNASDHELSRSSRGAIIGAADGFLFLGLLGTLLGILFAYFGQNNEFLLIPLALGGIVLALGAIFFGVLAYAVIRNGVWAVVGLFFGGLTGAILATVALGVENLLLGVVPGMAAGILVSFLLSKFQPQFQEPRVAAPIFKKWRQGGEDIQADPPEGGADSIQDSPSNLE